MVEKRLTKAINIRIPVDDGTLATLEEVRLKTPIQDRLTKTAFYRKIFIEYAQMHGKETK